MCDFYRRIERFEVVILLSMDDEKIQSGGSEKTVSQNDSDAMKKCLEENKDDGSKCKALVEAFKDSAFSTSATKKPWRPIILRRGALTDV